jgi:hypothetical protein
MREKADLREANPNGAILAGAKLGGARSTRDSVAPLTPRCELHRDHLGRYTVTPITIFDPDRCHSVTGAYRFPLWPSHFDPK